MIASTIFFAAATIIFPTTDSQIKLSQKRLGSKCVIQKKISETDQIIKYQGTIIEITENTVSLDDVTRIGNGATGIPFLSNGIPKAKLFRNVGEREEKLDVAVIINTKQIELITFTSLLGANSKDPFLTLKDGSRIRVDGIPANESMKFQVTETIDRGGKTRIEFDKTK